MKSKNLIILLVATGATVVGATVALRGAGSHAEAPAEQAKLFPMFSGEDGDDASLRAAMDRRNSVASIRVQRASGGYVVRRVGDAWTLQDKGDFPVQIDQVRKTINAIADATTVEAKTKDPARHVKLGVEDFDALDSKSVLVTLADKDGKELAQLVLGKEAEASGMQASTQRYVRKGGDAQSWLVSLKLDLPEKPTDWLAKEVLKVPQDRVRAIEIRQPDGETLLVDRSSKETKDFTLHGVPEGQEATYPTVANSLATGLEYVNLEDVSPASDVDFSAGTGPIARFTTFDGLVVTVTTKDQDGKSYASFAASYEAPATLSESTPETPAEGLAPPSAMKSADEVRKEVDALNGRLSKWAYVISSYSRAQFGKKLSELVKDAPPPAPPVDPNAAPEDLGGDDKPMIIPSDLPPEIRDQIKAHQESIGNKTIDGPARKKPEDAPADGEDAPPVDPDPMPDPDPQPSPDATPPQR